MTAAELDHWLLLAPRERRCLVMGVLNVTPDSFSDGGQFFDPTRAAEHALKMAADGADVIDIGGESTRPGSQPTSEADQIARVVPVLRAIAAVTDVVCSIDTTRAAVAAAALDAGAAMINDISAGRDDPAMLQLAASRAVPIVLMHMRGTPATMQQNIEYSDVVFEVTEFLRERAQLAEQAGIAPHRILIDSGIGFGKETEHNLQLLRDMKKMAESLAGRPLVIGASRKGFIGKITGVAKADQRQFGTAATVAWSVANGASMVRVHDVAEMAQVVRMVEAITGFE
jgi:dihydropteroate synthase